MSRDRKILSILSVRNVQIILMRQVKLELQVPGYQDF